MARKKAFGRRSIGTGSIYKIGRFYYLGITINGVKIKRSLKTGDREVAYQKADQLLEEISSVRSTPDLVARVAQARGIVNKQKIDEITKRIEKSSQFKMPLDLAMVAYEELPEQTASEATLKEYRRYWKKFTSFLNEDGDERVNYLHQVSANNTRGFSKWLNKQNICASTYNRVIRFCKKIFTALKYEAGIGENPFDVVHTKKIQQANTGCELTESELSAVMTELDFGDHMRSVKSLFIISRHTGMRLKDASLLRWENIDFKRDIISIKPSKTSRSGKYVHLPILNSLNAELKEISNGKVLSGFVLSDIATMYQKDRSLVSNRVCKVIRKALPDNSAATFHSLRHTFVSECARAGVPLAIVQALVGHGSPAMTRHYTHLDIETCSKALKVLEESNSVPNQDYVTKLKLIADIVKTMSESNWENRRDLISAICNDI